MRLSSLNNNFFFSLTEHVFLHLETQVTVELCVFISCEEQHLLLLLWAALHGSPLYQMLVFITATGSHLLLPLLLTSSEKEFCNFFSSSMRTVTFPMRAPAFTGKNLLKHFH